MKPVISLKYLPVFRFAAKLFRFQSTSPVFYYSGGKIWIDNASKNIIGVKMLRVEEELPGKKESKALQNKNNTYLDIFINKK